jgi:hypothetical protein
MVVTTLADTTTTTDRPDPVEGWGRLDVDTGVFGGIVPADGAIDNGRVALAGCGPETPGVFPIWWSDGGLDFEVATGPEGVACFQQIEATGFGWFAAGVGPVFGSEDGKSWVELDIPGRLGYEETFQLGFADALFVSPDRTRLTILFKRAAEAESTIATLVTTTDGVNWAELEGSSGSLFDNGGVAEVIEGGDGLLAVGSVPGGEFVPTAAIFTSPDGLRWRRVTPRGDSNFDDKTINDVSSIGDRFVAVGGDFFQTGLMTAWSSPDGLEWTPFPSPPETTDPSVAYMEGRVVTGYGGRVWVSGLDFDARRPEPAGIAALWRSIDGDAWERLAVEDLDTNVPFEIFSSPDLRIGVWPPPYSLIDEPIVLYAAD